MKFPNIFRKEKIAPVVRLAPTIQALPPRRSAPVPAPTPRGKRFFTAGESKAFIGWDPHLVSADTAIYGNLVLMKARARDLARNNDYIKQFLRLLRSNVVGAKGQRLQCLLRNAAGRDRDFNTTLEGYWNAAGKLKNSPSVCGKMTRRDMANLWITTLAVDGEVIVVKHPGHSGNKYRYALQFVDTALLDSNMNEKLANGNIVKMGVELNGDNKPVAYHFLNHHPFDLMWNYASKGKHTRIEADRVCHDFLQENPGQTRGISWLASPAVRSHMLMKFEEAVVISSRVSASKMAFYKPNDEYVGEAPGDNEEDGGSEMLRSTVEPGMMELLPRGLDVETFDPNFPPGNMEEFEKTLLRGIASGLGVDYVSMANNLEGVNYSSIRAGQLEQREVYKALQSFYTEHFEDPIFSEWAIIQTLNPDVPIDARKVRQLIDRDLYKFIARGWAWVDPLKEVQANKQAVECRFTSHRRVVAETLGEDYEELLEEIAEDEKLMEEYGVKMLNLLPMTLDPSQQTGGADPGE